MLNIQDTWQAQILHLLRLELGGEGDGGSSLGTCLALEWILGKTQCLRGGITEERKEGMLWWWEELFISKTVLELVEKALHFLAVKNVPRGEVRTLSKEQEPLLSLNQRLCVLPAPVYLPPQDTAMLWSLHEKPICPGYSSDIYTSVASDHHCSVTSCILWRKRYKIGFSAITSNFLVRNDLKALGEWSDASQKCLLTHRWHHDYIPVTKK